MNFEKEFFDMTGAICMKRMKASAPGKKALQCLALDQCSSIQVGSMLQGTSITNVVGPNDH